MKGRERKISSFCLFVCSKHRINLKSKSSFIYLISLSLSLSFIASDAKKCRAYGRGIQPKGVRTGNPTEFRVVTKDAGEGVLKVTIIGPGKDFNYLQMCFDRFVNQFRWIGNSVPCQKSEQYNI